jgi:hypothetical protein
MRLTRYSSVCLAGIIFFMAGVVRAQLIDVDFNNDSAGAAHGGPNPGPTMSGAAVLGAAGDQWNGINVSTGTNISLFYSDGTASPVTMTFTSDGGYDAHAYSGSTPFNGTPYAALMEDYLFNGGVAQTVTLSGLPTNSVFDVVLYNAADTAGAGRKTFFTVNSTTQGSTWNGTSSTLIAGVDYVVFPSALSDGSGNLIITYTGNGTAEGDIDGFQIQLVAPTVTITNPAPGAVFVAPENLNIAASALVSSGTVTNVQFFANGVSMESLATPPFDITVSNLTPGSYGLTAVAAAAGIFATSSVVSVTVLSPGTSQSNNTAAYTWSTLAGYAGIGSADGVGGTAQFDGPQGTAVDRVGNVYVTDTYNDTVRMITPAGNVTTIAGVAGASGTNDGEGSLALFNSPAGVTVDSVGNLYVADQYNYTIRKITPTGGEWVVSTISGNNNILTTNSGLSHVGGSNRVVIVGYFGGSADGTNTAAQFNLPQGIAVDGETNLYVTDTYNNTIRKITPVGTNWVVTTIAGLPGNGSGAIDGTNGNAQFYLPSGIAVDGATNLYVTDADNDTIREINPVGTNWVTTTIAGLAGFTNYGSTNGIGSAARFNNPLAVAVDSATNLYVADEGNTDIRKITPMPPTSNHGFLWGVSTFAGSPGRYGTADGAGTNAEFGNPYGISADNAGNLYVADAGSGLIRKTTPAAAVSTIAGSVGGAGSANGVGASARFDQPYGVAVETNGTVYVADTYNYTIRQITSLGAVSTIAGVAGSPGSSDGTNNTARFDAPFGIAVDNAGNLFVSDSGNRTIRKITPTEVVTTIAGTAGSIGTNDGVGAAARFSFPRGMAFDGASNLFVADALNYTIREITPVGANWNVSTIAGLAGSNGSVDGVGSAARFNYPDTIAVENTSNLFVSDSYDTTPTIRKLALIGTNWVVSTITVVGGNCVAVDSAGNLYIVGDSQSTIKLLTPAEPNWIVNTIGGLAQIYGSADGAGSAARFKGPTAIAVDGAGILYVADTGNDTIRRGVFTDYGPANEVPYTAPPMSASLVVTLVPPEAGGQWRFPWEVAWRNSGQAASNLVAANYTVEFRAVSGWLAMPQNLTIAVTNGGTTQVTSQYYPTITTVDTNLGGTLTVTLGPSPPSGAGWRFLGDTTPFYPSGYSTNLVAGNYLIQFAAVSGRVTPPNLSVQVQAGLTTTLDENYLLAGSAPAQTVLPSLVPFAELSDLADYPFGFNGQLETDVGYGSGVAVETNVVLTAAHLVFNDQTLSYVNQAYWFFQGEAGVTEPEPLAARGWYVLSGYAAQRTNDLAIYTPDTSTPQSRNLDVAALYFPSPVAGGGYGGYLPSDASPNPWLTGNSLKMLVGYPVDGSEFGDASVATNAGRMYQTEPQPYPLSLASDPVADQQVYTAAWMLSYPGNSGGPLYVQFDGYYYPAAVYLGTLFNGVVPYASAVRAIDSNVVNLITLAATLGLSGTNRSGGGVINVIPGQDISSNPGLIEVTIAPPAAAQAGGAWKFLNQPDEDYSTKNPSVLAVTSTNAVQLQFNPISGWNLPASQSLAVSAGSITSITNSYTLAISWAAPGVITYGTSLGANQLDAVTVAPQGNYIYTPLAGDVLNAGTHTLSVVFTPTDTLDYGTANASTNVSLVVVPAPLTATAFDATWVIGQPFPVFTGAINGLTNNDNITATYVCNATTNSPPGTYAIMPSLVDPDDRQTNYIVNSVNGTLTISPATVTTVAPPVIQSTMQSGGSFSFTWSAATNQNYQIQATTDLTQGIWTTLTTGNTGANTTMTISETIDANGQQFYRVVLVP